MTWETPAWVEIRMDAELTAYLDDLERDAREEMEASVETERT